MDPLAELDSILLEPGMQVTIAFCKVLDTETGKQNVDKIAKELVEYYTAHGKVADLLHHMIENEVKITVDPSTLFRRNSVASKILTVFSKLLGGPYLRATFKSLVEETASLRQEDYEVDPNKMADFSEQRICDNAANLIRLANNFLTAVLDSVETVPVGMRQACYHLYTEVGKKFPDLCATAVGGFFFLRFVCPAIIAPEQYSLVNGSISATSRRILVLVSKLLQNISNGVTGTSKERFMVLMNDFVQSSSLKLTQFFANISQPIDRPTENPVSKSEADAARRSIVTHLKTNIHRVGRTLISGFSPNDTSQPAQLQRSEKRGYLLKHRGENVFTGADAWQKRWFLLRNNQLHYFKSAQDSLAAGVIPLPDTTCTSRSTETEFIFEIATSYRTYTLKATSQLEVSEWLEAIRVSKNAYEDQLADEDQLALMDFSGAASSASPSSPPMSSSSSSSSPPLHTQIPLSMSQDGTTTRRQQLSESPKSRAFTDGTFTKGRISNTSVNNTVVTPDQANATPQQAVPGRRTALGIRASIQRPNLQAAGIDLGSSGGPTSSPPQQQQPPNSPAATDGQRSSSPAGGGAPLPGGGMRRVGSLQEAGLTRNRPGSNDSVGRPGAPQVGPAPSRPAPSKPGASGSPARVGSGSASSTQSPPSTAAWQPAPSRPAPLRPTLSSSNPTPSAPNSASSTASNSSPSAAIRRGGSVGGSGAAGAGGAGGSPASTTLVTSAPPGIATPTKPSSDPSLRGGGPGARGRGGAPRPVRTHHRSASMDEATIRDVATAVLAGAGTPPNTAPPRPGAVPSAPAPAVASPTPTGDGARGGANSARGGGPGFAQRGGVKPGAPRTSGGLVAGARTATIGQAGTRQPAGSTRAEPAAAAAASPPPATASSGGSSSSQSAGGGSSSSSTETLATGNFAGWLRLMIDDAWQLRYFTIEDTNLCQYRNQQVTACETQFSLRGAVAFACLQSATFEVTLVGAQVLKFRADSNDQRQACIEAINHINTQTPSAKSIIKSGAVVCSIYGAPWTNTKLSLMDNCLMIQPSAQPSKVIGVGNCYVHKAEDSQTKFDIRDSDRVVSVECATIEDAKQWMVAIKKAKLTYWQSHQYGQQSVDLKSSSSAPNTIDLRMQRAPSQKDMRSYRRSFISRAGSTAATGPTAYDMEGIIERGYLLRYDSDKKGTRMWFTLRDTTLSCYKTERAQTALESVNLQQANIKYNSDSTEDLDFEISTKESSFVLEAANHVDLRQWIRAINNTRLRPAGEPEQPLEKSGVLYYQEKSERRGRLYWFVLKDDQMQYFDQATKEEGKPLGQINLGSAAFRTIEDKPDNANFFEVKTEKTHLFRAESADDRRNWIKIMKHAKLRYWMNPDPNKRLDTSAFGNCGYLMKRGQNIKNWCRRWFVCRDEYLLYFKSPKDPMPQGEIPFQSSYLRLLPTEDSQFRFEIQLEHRNYLLEASSQTDLDLWVKVIKQAKANYFKGREGASSVSLEASGGGAYGGGGGGGTGGAGAAGAAGSGNTPSEQQPANFADIIRNPDKEGFLTKQGVTVKSWKRRWFVLKGSSMYYFTSAQISPGEHVGMIPLKDSQVVPSQNSKDFAFQIVTRTRVFFLRAESEEEMRQWCSAIERSKSLSANDAALSSSTSSNSMTSSQVMLAGSEKKGWLNKKGKSNRIWRQRWFVLEDNLLSYYKTLQDKVPTGVIPLENCSISMSDFELFKKQNCFVISTRCRNYFVQASDQYEMACWIESIKLQAEKQVTEHKSANVRLFNRLNEVLAAHDRLSATST